MRNLVTLASALGRVLRRQRRQRRQDRCGNGLRLRAVRPAGTPRKAAMMSLSSTCMLGSPVRSLERAAFAQDHAGRSNSLFREHLHAIGRFRVIAICSSVYRRPRRTCKRRRRDRTADRHPSRDLRAAQKIGQTESVFLPIPPSFGAAKISGIGISPWSPSRLRADGDRPDLAGRVQMLEGQRSGATRVSRSERTSL